MVLLGQSATAQVKREFAVAAIYTVNPAARQAAEHAIVAIKTECRKRSPTLWVPRRRPVTLDLLTF